jgi:SAM-dependent methyltransferase
MVLHVSLSSPGHRPYLITPRLPSVLTVFPLTRWLHARLYEDRLEDYEIFRRLVLEESVGATAVCDFGAGRGAGFLVDLRGKVARIIGTDVSDEVSHNPYVTEWYVEPNGMMPAVEDASVDLVYSRYVFEHVRDPSRVLREIRRVLKPGGRLVLLTPNRRHYLPVVAQLLGRTLQRKLNAMRGTPEEDTFPTVYAVNTPEEVEAVGRAAGFSTVEVALFEVQPNYLTFHPLAFAAGVAWERAVNNLAPFSRFRGSLIARLTA